MTLVRHIDGWRRWWSGQRLLIALLACLLIWTWWDSRAQIAALRTDVAIRLKDDEALSRQTQG